MVVATSFFHMFCLVECCSRYYIPHNITGELITFIMSENRVSGLFFFHFVELDLRLTDQLMGQPLAHNLILKSISAHINTENPGKALVLSLHGSTGTGQSTEH